MIITQLIGGLGNQMFQYAIGRHLAYKNQTKLKLDISEFETYKLHRYSLSPFNIQENFALLSEIARFKKRGISRLMEKFKPYYRYSFIKEASNPHFNQNMLKISDNVYLKGYWQSEKYFKGIENIIRQEFTLKPKQQNAINKKLLQIIEKTESVAVHIRRKDYILSKTHQICPLNYYYSAIKKLAKVTKNPHFFIFSDDIEWAKNNLELNYPVIFVSNSQKNKNWEDLILISKCKYQIIANSSFSWWGAWLNTNLNKIIIAPQRWYNDPNRNTKDLIPKQWIKM